VPGSIPSAPPNSSGPDLSSISRVLILGLFVASGAAGLVYQVVWSRLLTQLFGSTVVAVSTVLCAFMTGLAIGAALLGRRADTTTNPLRLYAIVEIGIGLTALLTLLALDNLTAMYVGLAGALGGSELALTITRFGLATLLILVPTSLMGATLPILARAWIRQLTSLGRSIGQLYAANTLGAVTGTLLAGFYLIRTLGIHGTVYTAVAANVGVGLVAWQVSRRLDASAPRAREPPPTITPTPTAAPPALLLWAIAISGFTSFGYEVLWTRSLIFAVGNSTYAFVVILTAFLAGLAIGGVVVSFVADRARDPTRLFGWVQIGVGASAAAAVPVIVALLQNDAIERLLGRFGDDTLAVALQPFATSMTVMLIPTILIGMTAGEQGVRERHRAGRGRSRARVRVEHGRKRPRSPRAGARAPAVPRHPEDALPPGDPQRRSRTDGHRAGAPARPDRGRRAGRRRRRDREAAERLPVSDSPTGAVRPRPLLRRGDHRHHQGVPQAR